MITCIKNANLVLSDEVRRASVTFSGKILEIGEYFHTEHFQAEHCIDGEGLYLTPGFIDIHTHGCAGMSATDGTAAVLGMAENMLRGGVTAFLPTTVSAAPEELRRSLQGIGDAARTHRENAAKILGAHMEGPYLNKLYKGAHEEAVLTDPEVTLTEEFRDVIKLVTVAPELNGAENYIRRCMDLGIRVSIGHTGASYEQCAEAVQWGAKSFTHTYNALSPLHHREAGAVGAAMTLDNTFCELIADNHHVSIPAQKVLFRAAGADRLILVSDSLGARRTASTDEEAEFYIGSLKARIIDGVARLTDGTIAGSILTLNRAVWNLHKNTGATLPEAVRCATRNPAALLGIDIPQLAPGCPADLVLLDKNFDVATTFIDGLAAYSRQ